MSLTLRQVQKMFSASCKGGKSTTVRPDDRKDCAVLGQFGKAIGGERFLQAVIAGGYLRNACDCSDCRAVGLLLKHARSVLDGWVRKHGPDADLASVVQQALQEKPANQDGRGDEQQSQQRPPQNQQSQSGRSSGSGSGNGEPSEQASGNGAQTTGPAPQTEAHPAARPFEPQAAPSKPAPTPMDKARETQQAAKAKIAEAKQALQAARKGSRKSAATRSAVYTAKRKLREARKQASFNKVAMASAPSLSARQSIARSNGRLQRVPQALRNKMADLINRLVMQGGTAGDNPSPTPLLSAQKVVKRFLVRRPLSNAFKEDTIIGRPVTMFLPDVSPSCAAQAQTACDLANAAGFAGVSGSDVLVFPHANGCVRSNDEDYIPWFNGKPMLSELPQIGPLFEEVCAGQSRFRVRVVVLLGDHDAVARYGAIAALRSVRRVIWLHNWGDSDGSSTQPPEMAEPSLLPPWPAEAMKKLTMVAGCGGQRTMLQGFEMALRR